MNQAMIQMFLLSFAQAQSEAHKNAVDKGFWGGQINMGERLALIHSEVSEALEAARKGNPPDSKIPEFNSVTAELADVIIRVMDLAGGLDLSLAAAILAKMEHNKGRGYRHGKFF